jgi:NSS family neurotransmitter:Na+ symporter
LPWAQDAEGFFFNSVLRISEGPFQLGGLVWPLVVGAALTWLISYFITRQGTKSVGAVVKWTVPLPYLLLGVLLIHGLAREGAIQGLLYYLTPNWDLLSNPQVWMAAYGQVFFSLSLGFGIMIAYASYLKEKEDLPWQANFMALANSATEFFAGFVVFSVLGALAAISNVSVADVAASGPGLAFVAFPAALAALPGAKFFSILFFVMLITLGIDSAFSLLEAAATAVHDRYPNLTRKRVLQGLCVVGFLISLLFVTNAGLYWLDIVDHWMNAYGLVGVGLAEAVIVSTMLGTRKLKQEMNEHTVRPVGKIWEISLWVITPFALIITLILSFQGEFTAPYGDYPAKALAIGGWAVWSATILLALLLQKDKVKWAKILGFLAIAVIVIIAQVYSAAAAMGLFGATILLGGMAWLVVLDRKKKQV